MKIYENFQDSHFQEKGKENLSGNVNVPQKISENLRYEAIWGRGRCEMSETLLILGYLGYRVHLRCGPSLSCLHIDLELTSRAGAHRRRSRHRHGCKEAM